VIEISPRKWQNDALKLWHQNGNKGIVSVVTGGGKSVFGCICAKDLLDVESNLSILVVVPTVTLQDQWVLNLIDFFKISLEDVSVWRTGKMTIKRFNVCIINSLCEVDDPNNFFLIADECHRYGSDRFFKNINQNWRKTVGLSATPKREYDDFLTERLIPLFGEVIFSYTYLEAHRDKVINDFDIYNVFSSLSDEEQSEYDNFTKKIAVAIKKENFEAHKILLIKRNRIVIESKNRLLNTLPILKKCEGKRTIVFFESVKFAKIFAQILQDINRPGLLYHSKQSNSLRYQSLRLFKDGFNNLLIACRALDEGLDIPNIECAIIVSSSSTKRQRIQRIGRALRISQGKGRSQIYTLYSTENERKRLTKEISTLSNDVEVTWLTGR
jgi:superfamily II DNA or RNA helicase